MLGDASREGIQRTSSQSPRGHCWKQKMGRLVKSFGVRKIREIVAHRDLSLMKLSISSMKMMEGCSFFAREKRAATSLLDSPNHLSVKVETCMLMKVAPDSFASAFAKEGGFDQRSDSRKGHKSLPLPTWSFHIQEDRREVPPWAH